MTKKIIALTLVLILVLTACATADRPLTAAELLDLGEKYLAELNYAQALVQFTKLIEIDPKNPRGYTGASEAYMGLGDKQKAADVLTQGMAIVSAEDLSDLQARLEAVLASIEEMPAPPTTPEPTPETITEPTPLPEPLSFAEPSPFAFIGAAPDTLAAVLGEYVEKTQGDGGTLYRYGHTYVAYDREKDGEPDGLAHLLLVPLGDLLAPSETETIAVSELDALFGQTGESAPGILQYVYQEAGVVLDEIPAEGRVPLSHLVVISVDPRPEESTPPPTPKPSTAPSAPVSTAAPAPTATPTPTQEPEDEYEDVEIEIDIPVLH